MLDINLIRENPERVREGARKKGAAAVVDDVVETDAKWREAVGKLDELRAEQKKFTGGGANAEELKSRIKELSSRERALLAERNRALERLPNIPFDNVPEGEDESGNVVVREEGKKPNFGFKPRDYLSIAEKLGIIDVKRAAEVAGSRFGYLLGDAALLEFALVKLVFDTVLKEGFVPVVPPALARPEVMRKMGKGKFIDENDAFYISEDGLYLIGSAEHTIGPLHMSDVLDEQDLPRRYVGFSTAFRREAGSYGRDTKGILRVHQFDKVELFSFAHPKYSEEEHRFLLSMQEKLMGKLKLPYRVVEVCTGDMTFADARQYDIETWFPSEGKYRETHSASNTTDFQARGINARYRPSGGGKPEFLHMLNATGFAIGRTIAAIVENYQTKDGNVEMPRVLRKYMGKRTLCSSVFPS